MIVQLSVVRRDVMHVDPLTQQERTYCEANFKRLEQGNYEMPRHAAGTKRLELNTTQLGLLLSGVKLDAPQRRRYVRPPALAG
jgi:hypothetical protein